MNINNEIPDKELIVRIFIKSLSRLHHQLESVGIVSETHHQKNVKNPEHSDGLNHNLMLDDLYDCLKNSWTIAEKMMHIIHLTKDIVEFDQDNHHTTLHD